MQPKDGSVRELDMLDAFDEMASEYANEFGIPPFNVSHWDSLASFTDRVSVPLPLSTLPNVLEYQYSYDLTMRSEVVRKLGFPNHEHASLITPSGTSAIVCLLNLLRILQIRNVVSTSPVYFPVVHNSDAYGIRLKHYPMNRTEDGFRLATPILTDQIPPSDAIWITNPIYSSSVYLTKEDLDALERHMYRGGFVIADEALAIPGREIARTLGHHEKFLGLYTPHKAICVNGVKFGAIVGNKKYQRHLDHWADVLIGGIGVSSVIAVEHFLSEQFEAYQQAFLEQMYTAREFVDQLAERLPHIELDLNASGHFISVYASHLPGDLDLSAIRSLMWTSGASLIPGRRNHFGPELPFCWRINLARDGRPFRAALGRLMTAVNQFSLD